MRKIIDIMKTTGWILWIIVFIFLGTLPFEKIGWVGAIIAIAILFLLLWIYDVTDEDP